MGIKYKLYPERKLLVDIFEGEITLKDIKKIHLIEQENINFSEINKSVTDIRNAKFKITLKEVKSFIQFMKNPNDNKEYRWAVLARNPMQTALSLLVNMDKYYRDIFKVFSTIEGCRSFLEVNYSEEEFNDDDFIIVK